jgi:2-isopropylmalate synthase
LLLFLLSFQKEKIINRLGFDGQSLFLSPPDLKMLQKIAILVSEYTGIPLKVTDPIVGTGINTISTGTPFVDTKSFQPFDSETVLDIPRKIHVTQLASHRVIVEVAKSFGYQLNEIQINQILDHVKKVPYQTGRPVFPENELRELFKRVIHDDKVS